MLNYIQYKYLSLYIKITVGTTTLSSISGYTHCEEEFSDMDILAQYHPLFLTGVALMAASVVGAVITFAVLRFSGKRLREKLAAEFGPRRH